MRTVVVGASSGLAATSGSGWPSAAARWRCWPGGGRSWTTRPRRRARARWWIAVRRHRRGLAPGRRGRGGGRPGGIDALLYAPGSARWPSSWTPTPRPGAGVRHQRHRSLVGDGGGHLPPRWSWPAPPSTCPRSAPRTPRPGLGWGLCGQQGGAGEAGGRLAGRAPCRLHPAGGRLRRGRRRRYDPAPPPTGGTPTSWPRSIPSGPPASTWRHHHGRRAAGGHGPRGAQRGRRRVGALDHRRPRPVHHQVAP